MNLSVILFDENLTRKSISRVPFILLLFVVLFIFIMTCEEKTASNWVGNIFYDSSQIFYPKSIREVQTLIQNHNSIRPLGTTHSFTGIISSNDSKTIFISNKYLDKIVNLNKNASTVTIESGVTYRKLANFLEENGFALHNLLSVLDMTIAGTISTGAHGSRVQNGNIATAVEEIEFLTGNGEIITLSRENDSEIFDGVIVNLGGFGFASKLTLKIQPSYMIKTVVYENLSMETFKDHFNEILSSGYTVSMFTDWQNKNINEVWIKTIVKSGEKETEVSKEFFGAKLAKEKKGGENATEQMGIPGPWHERLSNTIDIPKNDKLGVEYFIPISHTNDAITALETIHELLKKQCSEIRTIASDNLWLSPCYKRDCLAITFEGNSSELKKLLPIIEEKLEPYEVRPHWGKIFTMTPERIRSIYPKSSDFKKLMKKFDPNGKFRNKFLNDFIYE